MTSIQRDKCGHKLDPFGTVRIENASRVNQTLFQANPFFTTKIWVYKVGAIHFREKDGRRKKKRKKLRLIEISNSFPPFWREKETFSRSNGSYTTR